MKRRTSGLSHHMVEEAASSQRAYGAPPPAWPSRLIRFNRIPLTASLFIHLHLAQSGCVDRAKRDRGPGLLSHFHFLPSPHSAFLSSSFPFDASYPSPFSQRFHTFLPTSRQTATSAGRGTGGPRGNRKRGNFFPKIPRPQLKLPHLASKRLFLFWLKLAFPPSLRNRFSLK